MSGCCGIIYLYIYACAQNAWGYEGGDPSLMVCDIQKTNLWKRFSAYLFDVILFGIVAVGFAFLLSALLGYSDVSEERKSLQAEFEQAHGVSFELSQDEYNAMAEDEREVFDGLYREFVTDPAVGRLDSLLINFSLIITSIGILASYLVLELLIPLLLKNGQTLGKKIFGIGVMRVDCVRMSTFQLAVRTVLGKYTLETMLPVLMILMFFFGFMPLACAAGILLILIMQIIFLVSTRLRTPIHDMIAGTVVVDVASQMIFESVEEMNEYKKRLHEEDVKRAPYP